MQRRHFLILAFLPFIISASVGKKDQSAGSDFSVEGNYVNKGDRFDKSFYSFSIEISGVLRLRDINGEEVGQGHWELAADNFVTGTYKFLNDGQACSFRAKLNMTSGRLDGCWGNKKNVKDGRHLFMKRTN